MNFLLEERKEKVIFSSPSGGIEKAKEVCFRAILPWTMTLAM